MATWLHNYALFSDVAAPDVLTSRWWQWLD